MLVSFRETMSRILNTVSVLALPNSQHPTGITAVTISSLVSTTVQDGQEEILFVLKNGSYAGDKLITGTKFSINVLSESQKNIADIYASKQAASEEIIASSQLIWSDIQTFPKLSETHVYLKCVIKEFYSRELSTIFFANVLEHEFSAESKPLLHFHRRYYVIGSKL
jgi:flavin reductase (DIM6/NTAB) family NADH-FMN oxidoreductase RutF